jgi:hypothetical protein
MITAVPFGLAGVKIVSEGFEIFPISVMPSRVSIVSTSDVGLLFGISAGYSSIVIWAHMIVGIMQSMSA